MNKGWRNDTADAMSWSGAPAYGETGMRFPGFLEYRIGSAFGLR